MRPISTGYRPRAAEVRDRRAWVPGDQAILDNHLLGWEQIESQLSAPRTRSPT